MVLDFAVTINKPALPLPFTGGDSLEFWKTNKDRVKKWFDLADDFADELAIERLEKCTPSVQDGIIKKIITSIGKAIEKESSNQEYYQKLQKEFKVDVTPSKKKKLLDTRSCIKMKVMKSSS